MASACANSENAPGQPAGIGEKQTTAKENALYS
jgi:hypothetical protein